MALPGLAEQHLEVPLGGVQAAPEEQLELEALQVRAELLELELLPRVRVRLVQSLEQFLLLVLQLRVLEWLAWSALR